MAVYCEASTVVEQVRSKIQNYYDTLKRDVIAETLYCLGEEGGRSPPPEYGDMMFHCSRSLEKDQPLSGLTRVPNTQKNSSGNTGADNKTGVPTPVKRKLKTISFSSSYPSSGFAFEKERVPNKRTATSSLTRLIKTEGGGPTLSASSSVEDLGGFALTVHTWHPHTLKVSIFDNKATVGHVITATLKQFAAQKIDAPPTLDVQAYSLRIADSSGRVDDDYPALDEKQAILKFKNEHFVLCRRTRLMPARKDSGIFTPIGVTPPTTASTSLLDSPVSVFKINLPNKTTTKVHYQADLKLADLMKQICRKRVLFVNDHYFVLPGTDTPLDLTLTMEQVGSNELTLCEHAPSVTTNSGGDETDESRPEIFWYDGLASQYKTYNVVKLKKYGTKQDRVLGIDRDRITNMPPNNAKNTAKRPSRYVKDVVRVCELDKPKQFAIDYSDGKSYTYEARSTSIAREIVGKISYLLKSERLRYS